jgi:hypothetical protein
MICGFISLAYTAWLGASLQWFSAECKHRSRHGWMHIDVSDHYHLYLDIFDIVFDSILGLHFTVKVNSFLGMLRASL